MVGRAGELAGAATRWRWPVPWRGRLVAGALLALVSGCDDGTIVRVADVAQQQGAQPTDAGWVATRPGARLRLDDGPTLWLRVRTPPLDVPDPALEIATGSWGDHVAVDGRPLAPVATWRLVPLDPRGSVVQLRFTSTVRGSVVVPRFAAGSQRALWGRALAIELPDAMAAGAVLLAGLLLLAGGLRRGGARAYRGLGLFLAPIGLLTVINQQHLRALSGVSPAVFMPLHHLATTLYPLGFADFALGIFGDGRWRILGRGARVYVVYALGAWMLHLSGLLDFGVGRSPAAAFIVVFAVYAALLAARRARAGDGAARAFLYGIGALVVISTPDILDGLGLVKTPRQFVLLGIIAFALAMVVVLARQFRQARDELAAKVAALEETNREVQTLNRELRHQIAERSRQLGAWAERGGPVTTTGALRPGQLVDDRYLVLRALGEGGMGAVYEAERCADGRRFALKVMSSFATPKAAARFAREAEIAARIADPHLVGVVDVGGAGTGRFYLVMELVEGESLAAERHRWGDVPWALEVLAQVARGLRALHQAGVTHRDLKPDNVLLARDADGRVCAKIADFGIAYLEDPSTGEDLAAAQTLAPALLAAAASPLTATGVIMGTPAYMAPELARGAHGARPAADLFSFGLIAHELLTGRPAFKDAPVLAVSAGRPLPEPAPLPAAVPAAVGDVVGRCLRQDPDARPSAAEVVAAVERSCGTRAA